MHFALNIKFMINYLENCNCFKSLNLSILLIVTIIFCIVTSLKIPSEINAQTATESACNNYIGQLGILLPAPGSTGSPVYEGLFSSCVQCIDSNISEDAECTEAFNKTLYEQCIEEEAPQQGFDTIEEFENYCGQQIISNLDELSTVPEPEEEQNEEQEQEDTELEEKRQICVEAGGIISGDECHIDTVDEETCDLFDDSSFENPSFSNFVCVVPLASLEEVPDDLRTGVRIPCEDITDCGANSECVEMASGKFCSPNAVTRQGTDACYNADNTLDENGQACINCYENGGLWVAIGCVDPTPLGIITGLIRIAFGVMGGVALLQLIQAGVMYQKGDQAGIEKAKGQVIATLSGIALLVFSVLALRIIGINVLDVLPEGSV